MAAPLFSIGQLVVTPGALALLAEIRTNPAELLARHQAGDWGEVPPKDARENEFSVLRDFRILSSYWVGKGGENIWIITEADRSSTCILLSEEYKCPSQNPSCLKHKLSDWMRFRTTDWSYNDLFNRLFD